MAGLNATFMQAYAQLVNGMSTNEIPVNKKHGAINGLLMLGESPFAPYPQSDLRMRLEALDYTTAGSLKIPALSADGVTVHASRQALTFADPTTGLETSRFVSPTIVTVEVDFMHIPSDYANNAVNEASGFALKLFKAIQRMGNAADAAALTILDAAKNQVDPFNEFMTFAADTLTYTDSTSGGKLEEFIANVAIVMGEVPPICEKLNQEQPVLVIGTPSMSNILKANSMYSAGNKFDSSMFSQSAIALMTTNNVTPTPGAYAKGYFINPGQVQACTFLGQDARARRSTADAPVEPYTDPAFNNAVQVEYRIQRKNFDLSATRPGATVVYGEKHTLTMNIAFVTTSNSNIANNPTGVLAFEVIKA